VEEASFKNAMKYAEVQVRIPNLEGDGISEIYTLKVPVVTDPDTGEELLTEEAVEMIDNTKARYMGLLLPHEIKALRENLGLTQKQMSELLQAGEKSYTRWESGKSRPSRMVNLLLRALFEGELTPDQLRRIGAPRTEGGPSKQKRNSASKWVRPRTHGVAACRRN
jgi:putative zinc finger/helix-turn-helix YgiT family protein